ncbi:cytochrome P450 [Rhizophagus irregularis DAOM 181602=DAOM 197198]|nr:cytochrome P450 [Rhizophagus irregularis DAOM 181602=DAOM 197198]
MLTGKRSYSMTAYFNTISDEKFDHQSARQMIYFKTRRKEIEDTPLNEPLSHDMLTSMIIKNTLRDGNYIETDEANRSMTDSEIRAANMLSFIIYYIAYNPNVKKKMLEEIDSIFQALWAFFVKSARVRDAQFHGTSMHKLPERLDQTKFLTNHQNKYHRIVTKFLAKRKTDQRINRSEKLQDEFDKLDLEYYNPRPRSTIDPATSNDKKNLEIRTNKRLLTHRHIYFQ